MNAIQLPIENAIGAPQVVTEELYHRFIAFIDATPKTIETYTRALRQLFHYFSAKNITQPQRSDIVAYRNELKETLKPATVQSYITATRLFFQWTGQEHLYPNIANHIKGATISRAHKKDYLTSQQVKAILASVSRDTLLGLRDYAMLALMITGGLRTIEIVRANIVDMRTRGDETVLFIQGKGQEEKAEYIKVRPLVEIAIRAYLRARGTAEPAQPLFASISNNSNGQSLTTRSVSRIIKARLQAAGYDSDRLTAHSLRHTAVTLSLLGGNSLQEVQQFARHSNITTTQLYAHNLERANNKCEETIAAAIF